MHNNICNLQVVFNIELKWTFYTDENCISSFQTSNFVFSVMFFFEKAAFLNHWALRNENSSANPMWHLKLGVFTGSSLNHTQADGS